MEQQFVVNQSSTLIRKSSNEEPFFEANAEGTPETADLISPNFASLEDYLSQRIQPMTNSRKDSLPNDTVTDPTDDQDIADISDRNQDGPAPSTTAIFDEQVRPKIKKKSKRNQFVDDEAEVGFSQTTSDHEAEYTPTKKSKKKKLKDISPEVSADEEPETEPGEEQGDEQEGEQDQEHEDVNSHPSTCSSASEDEGKSSESDHSSDERDERMIRLIMAMTKQGKKKKGKALSRRKEQPPQKRKKTPKVKIYSSSEDEDQRKSTKQEKRKKCETKDKRRKK